MPRGITDPGVLKAFLGVKRHSFVPPVFREEAYVDRPLPIGEAQTISQPYMVALMTECLGLSGGERVLEIGTGSGYQAAVLAELCGMVYTIEAREELLERAKHVLSDEGYTNIRFLLGDGTRGWPEESPFDRIIVTAAAPHIPVALKEQLCEKGRLVIPVGDRYSQMLTVVEKKGGIFTEESVCGCVFVPLVGEDGWKE